MRALRLAIACSSLCASRGGSERAATNMAAEMARRGHAALLLSLSFPGQPNEPCYGLPPNVRHLSIDGSGRHDDIRRLRDFLVADATDIFLSMQSSCHHLFWAVACMGSGIPFICSERCDPVLFIERQAWNRAGRLAVLSGSDVIHELLPTYNDSVPQCFQDRIKVIPNAAPVFPSRANPVGGERKRLLYLARLCDQKRPLLLLEAFRLVMDKHPEWDLDFWGHGPQEAKLRGEIAKNGFGERVKYRGLCTDSAKAYAESQIYCLPSAFEGFPNTILEAMSAGLPVVGFSSCAGSRGVIEDNVTGLLARSDDAHGLACVLDKLMGDAGMREQFGHAALKASENYAADRVFDQWEALFKKTATLKGHTAMDAFYAEPFASKARLSAAARREWLGRDFGESMPYSLNWLCSRSGQLLRGLGSIIRKKFKRCRCTA